MPQATGLAQAKIESALAPSVSRLDRNNSGPSGPTLPASSNERYVAFDLENI